MRMWSACTRGRCARGPAARSRAHLRISGVRHVAVRVRAGSRPPPAAAPRSPAAGGSTSGLPSVKSKTFSAPRSAFSRTPSSNMRRIHDACSSRSVMLRETPIADLALAESAADLCAADDVDARRLQALDGRVRARRSGRSAPPRRSRPKAKAYMYSMLMPGLRTARGSRPARPAGRAPRSPRTSVTLTTQPAASSTAFACCQSRHDQAQDAEVLRVGQRQREDVDARPRPAAGSGSMQLTRACSRRRATAGGSSWLQSPSFRRSMTRLALPSLRSIVCGSTRRHLARACPARARSSASQLLVQLLQRADRVAEDLGA